MSTHPVELFCSYANADEPLYLELEKHLSLLHREGVISFRHKRQIIAGTDWTKALDEHLNTASVILLLVSSDFVASDYCYGTEMQRAMERYEAGDAHVIPILLRPVDWQNSPFGKLQALPSSGKPITQWRNRDAAFADVAQGIREVLGNTPIVASTSSATLKYSSLLPDSPDPPPPTPLREHNKFNAIYLLKIIEEHGVTPDDDEEIPVKWQIRDGTRKTTAWLAAEGDVTYVVDSITISHRTISGGRLHPARSGAILPDAQYRFPIRANSTKTYALNPALVLSHEDRREVSFSLKLIPPKKGATPWFDSGGPLNVVLHYHAFDGTQGKLYLAPPSEDGIVLSQLLKVDIEMNGLVICPKGCQRGVDENGESEQVREIFSYKPLMSPYGQIMHHLGSENASSPFSLTPERQTLNKAIEETGILSHIQNLLMKAKDARGPRRDLLFDLCAGHPHASCELALIQVGISEIVGGGTLPNDGNEKEKKAENVHKASPEGSLAEVCYYHTVVSVSDSASIGIQTGSHEQMKGHKNGNRIVKRIISWVTASIHAAFLGKKRPNDQTRLEQSQAHTDSGYTIIMNWHKTQTWLEQSQEHVYSQDILDSVVGALAIRHLLQPSETLADFLLKLSHTRSLGSATHAAFAALVIHRKGEWIQALTTLHKFDGLIAMSVLQVLILIRDNLTEEERHIADEFAREQSEPFLKLDTVDCQRIYHTSIESAIKYLLRIDSSSLEIRQKLLAWKKALPRTRKYSALQKKEFKRWIKSLLDLTD